jgi:hypothetical protein
MRNLKKSNRFASEEFTAEDIIAIEELEEQLADELEMDDVKVETSEDDELIAEAEEILKAFEEEEPAAEPAPAVEAEEETPAAEETPAVEAEADTEVPDDKEIISEEEEILKACEELEAKIAAYESKEACDEVKEEEVKTASETTPGIEDEIGDEAKGGDPSVSTITDSKVDVSTDKEVFPTNSEYVAKITARLDRVANILEKRGMKRMAFRVDQLSDKLEASIRK